MASDGRYAIPRFMIFTEGADRVPSEMVLLYSSSLPHVSGLGFMIRHRNGFGPLSAPPYGGHKSWTPAYATNSSNAYAYAFSDILEKNSQQILNHDNTERYEFARVGCSHEQGREMDQVVE